MARFTFHQWQCIFRDQGASWKHFESFKSNLYRECYSGDHISVVPRRIWMVNLLYLFLSFSPSPRPLKHWLTKYHLFTRVSCAVFCCAVSLYCVENAFVLYVMIPYGGAIVIRTDCRSISVETDLVCQQISISKWQFLILWGLCWQISNQRSCLIFMSAHN